MATQRSQKKVKPVAVVMGSQSDWPTMKEAVTLLKSFGVKTHHQVLSAHRMAKDLFVFGSSAASKYSVVIAGAGGAAHLPGMLAALTSLPVIGVPIRSSKLAGLDSLLSIVQMPRGVPVATVSIEGGTNAGLLAIRILSLSDHKLELKLRAFQDEEKKSAKSSTRKLK